jgi:hypothetical protein
MFAEEFQEMAFSDMTHALPERMPGQYVLTFLSAVRSGISYESK